MTGRIPPFLLSPNPFDKGLPQRGIVRHPFIDKALKRISGVISSVAVQWSVSSRGGPFHSLDARVKVIFWLMFIIVISLKRDVFSEAAITFFIFFLVVIAGIRLLEFYRRALLFGFLFGFCVALPASLNVFSKGEVIAPLLTLPGEYHVLAYDIPQRIGITREGLHTVILLTLRVLNSISLSLFILQTTPFNDIVKALKVFKVPDAFLMIIALTYKYIFIFAKTVEDMYLAQKSRLAGPIGADKARELISGRIVYLFRKTRTRCDELFKAMLCRGFDGEFRLPGFGRLPGRDRAALFSLCSAGVFFLWL